MPIINQFDNNIIEVISDGITTDGDYSQFKESDGHFIRMTVINSDNEIVSRYYSDLDWDNNILYFDDDGNIYENYNLSTPFDIVNNDGDLNVQLPIYRDVNNKIFIKPNDTMAADVNISYGTGNYTLIFDFFDDVFNTFVTDTDDTPIYDNPRFYLNQISTSRKEVRLIGRQGDNELLELDADVISIFNSILYNASGEYDYNYVLSLPDTQEISILNHGFDTTTLSNTSLVLKLYDTVPTDITTPVITDVNVYREIYTTQTEDILYISSTLDDINYISLTPDTNSVLNQGTGYNDTLQSYNDLIYSSSLSYNQRQDIFRNVFSSSENALDIDFSNFSNHVFFGSAEKKVRNFYSKVEDIQLKLDEISSSLNDDTYGFVTESSISVRRKYLFDGIDEIVHGFTPYEKFMYYDTHNTSSYPKAGMDYSHNPPISGSFNSSESYTIQGLNGDASLIQNYHGMGSVYKITTEGEDVSISGSFSTSSEDAESGLTIHNYWYTGSDGWELDGGSASFTPWGSNKELIQISGSIESDVILTGDLEQVKNYNQFNSNRSYNVSFRVTDVISSGNITFKFGNHGTGQFIVPVSNEFNITTIGTESADVHIEGAYKIPSPYNYLVIAGDNSFEGAIDDISVTQLTDTDGRADIFTDKYKVQDAPFYNYNGPYYLSFLAKWPSMPTWENYNSSQSIPNDGFNPIPHEAWNGYYTQSIDPDNDRFERYIMASSQSYWRYPDDNTQENSLDIGTSTDNTKWEILSGSHITGSYNMEFLDAYNHYDSLLTYGNKSILPSGELFRLYHTTSSDAYAPITSSFLMDVKLFKEDELWSGSVGDTLIFSNLYDKNTSIVSDWYSSILSDAVKYDKENIHSMFNNLPLHVREGDDNDMMNSFMSMIGEHYDVLKNYIDNYLVINSREYNSRSNFSHNLYKIIGENFGWKFINTNSIKNLVEYYVGIDSSLSYENLTKQIWQNILNNLVYIYKSKGTESSIRALMNSFGIPPNVISIDEGGGAIQSQTNPQIDFESTHGIISTPGNISFREQRGVVFEFLNFNSNNNSYKTHWNTYKSNNNTAVEFMFSSMDSDTNQNLIKITGSDSQELWNLRLMSTSSNSSSGSIRFELNTSQYGSASIGSNNVYIESDELYIKNNSNRKLWNVIIQQRSLSNSTGSYELFIANRDGDILTNYWTGSISVTSSFANENFTSTGSIYSSGSNLIFGESLSGSMTEMRVWDGYVTKSKFYQHVFNPSSVVGNDINAFQDVIYRYTFNGNYSTFNSSSMIRDFGSQISSSFSQELGSGFPSPSRRRQSINIIRFNPRSIDIGQKNSNKIVLNKSEKFLGSELHPFNNSVENSSILFDSDNNRIRQTGNGIQLYMSPSNVVDGLISNYFNDLDLGSLIGNPLYQGDDEYPDLVNIQKRVLNQIDGDILNTNLWIKKQSKLISGDVWDIISTVIPEKVSISKGFEISNDILFRNKTPNKLLGVNSDQFIFELIDNISIENEIILSNSKSTGYIDNNEYSNLLDIELSNSDTGILFDSTIEEVTDSDNMVGYNSQFNESDDIHLEELINPTSLSISEMISNNSISDELDYDSDVVSIFDIDLYDYTDKYDSSISSISNDTHDSDLDVNDAWDTISSDISSDILPDNDIIIEDNLNSSSKMNDNLDSNLDTDVDDNISSEVNDIESDNIEYTDIKDISVEYPVDAESNLDTDVSNISSDVDNEMDSNLDIEYSGVSSDNINLSLSDLDIEIDDSINSESTNLNSTNLDNGIEDSISSDYANLPEYSIDEIITDPISDGDLSLESNLDTSMDDNISSENDDNLESTVDEYQHEIDSTMTVDSETIIDIDDEYPNLGSDTELGYDINSMGVDIDFPSTTSDVIGMNGVDDSSLDVMIFDGTFESIPQIGDNNDLTSPIVGDGIPTGVPTVDESVFTEFDWETYLDPNDTDHLILHPVSLVSGKKVEISSISYTIGDTETINLYGPNKSKTILIDLSTGIRDAGRYYPLEFDTTNPDFFRNKLIDTLNNKKMEIGRTILIYAYEFWHNTHISWGNDEDGFEWGSDFGEIHYPDNHYIHTTDDIPVFDSTIYSGGETPADITGHITSNDAVVIKTVGSSGTNKGNKLTVTKS